MMQGDSQKYEKIHIFFIERCFEAVKKYVKKAKNVDIID